MKSSTLRRSNLSKERMLVLEELSKNRQKPYDAAPGVYVRANKEKELDVLWQNFRVNQKEEKSAGVYLVTGFIAGAVSMLILTTLLSFSMRGSESPNLTQPAKQPQEHAKLTFIPADKSVNEEKTTTDTAPATAAGSESYTVKSGDTLAGIIVRFYGKYDVSKIDKVMKTNSMSNPNDLQIGQQLTMPMN